MCISDQNPNKALAFVIVHWDHDSLNVHKLIYICSLSLSRSFFFSKEKGKTKHKENKIK
uniref:Uncharacterized protein n=1 Tax=Rhizophora mucronata TaxID=61149 RepID=A0A2P2PBA7_RHIMU